MSRIQNDELEYQIVILIQAILDSLNTKQYSDIDVKNLSSRLREVSNKYNLKELYKEMFGEDV